VSRGRYHRVCHDFNIQLFAHRLKTVLDEKVTSSPSKSGDIQGQGYDPEDPPIPSLDSDDLKRLLREISTARRYLAQSHYFRDLYWQCKNLQKEQKSKLSS
jgi:hypothetical protein